MKITVLLALVVILASCQSTNEDETTPIPPQVESETGIQDSEDSSDDLDPLPENGVDLSRSSWDLVTSAFQRIDSFPLQSTVFPLQPILIDNDTLKMDDEICYYFPNDMASNFIQRHVEEFDSLGIWFEEYGSYMEQGNDFEFGMYPVGRFTHNEKNYFMYYTLDYLTGRGSFTLRFYLATATDEQWKSRYIGEKSYSKYNTYETIEGESFVKDRMASERNFTIDLQENKLVITHFSGDHPDGDDFDAFDEEIVVEVTELVLE